MCACWRTCLCEHLCTVCVLACVKVERSLTWLNSQNHPKAHGKSVGGQVWISDRMEEEEEEEGW